VEIDASASLGEAERNITHFKRAVLHQRDFVAMHFILHLENILDVK
jgi:hypothetical protein